MEFFDIRLQGIDAEGQEREFALSEFASRTVVLYFYPKDLTSGCTREACSFRDSMSSILPYAGVIGVSPDPVSRHLRFREQHQLNFPLLSDPEHLLAQAFDVWREKSMYGRKYMGIERSTFIIRDNRILHEWRKVKVNGHAGEVIDFLKNLQ